MRGEGLLRKIRFPLMDGEYLATEAERLLPLDVGLHGLLLDAFKVKNAVPKRRRVDLSFLDARALVPRGKARWEDYAGERRLAAHGSVSSLAACWGYVCGGLRSGSIQVWSRSSGRSTLEQERMDKTIHV